MSKRILPLIALTLTAAVVFTVVAHACSDLSSITPIVKAPCDHSPSQNEPAGKPENDNCDSVRYGMLSKQASYSETEFSKLYSLSLHESLSITVLLPDPIPSFWRSQALPGLAASPRLSHVVLRI
jgi:hypothetical protein